MAKKTERGNKKKEGRTFYKAVPTAITAPRVQEIELPRISVKTADFLENIIFFTVGTAEVLLFLRVVLMLFGVNGGNLLSYLLYASSYPFVLVFHSSQQQVPLITNQYLYENLAMMVIYFAVFYCLTRIVKAFKKSSISG